MNPHALLLVDVQRDFCRGGALAVKDGDAVVPPLRRMISLAAAHQWAIFATRDWHPRHSHHFAEFGGTWPVHCVQNTLGAEFHPEIAGDIFTRGAVIISTGTEIDEDGYSGFDGRTSSGQSLHEALKAAGVGRIFLGGLATDYCVRASALDATRLGYETHLLLDACRAVNLKPEDELRVIEEMKQAGVRITSIAEVLKSWKA